jgi:DNA-binding transcriptional LysR family regulator
MESGSFKGTACEYGVPVMFEDIHALVEFAEAGSIARAAGRLHRTPSAITRQMQRLEEELGAQLLDRSVKPPRLTPLGIRIVEQSREVLKRVGDLKALAANDAEPSGLFRIGVAHPLADGGLVEPVQALTRRFPKVRLQLLSDAGLIAKIRAGQLDLAVVTMAASQTIPPPLVADIVAVDRMVIVEKGRAGARIPTWQALAASQWVLNPPGCSLRAALLSTLEKAGPPAVIAAEIHNMHLQLAFIKAGYGRGLLPERFVRRYAGGAVRMVKPKDFELQMTIAVVRAGPLGSLEAVAGAFRDSLAAAFAS